MTCVQVCRPIFSPLRSFYISFFDILTVHFGQAKPFVFCKLFFFASCLGSRTGLSSIGDVNLASTIQLRDRLSVEFRSDLLVDMPRF